MGVVGKREQSQGYLEIHRLWCKDAYEDDCPGHADVEVLCKQGEMSMRKVPEYPKCSGCGRYLWTKFRYTLVAAIPPDVPRLPRKDVELILNHP